MAVGDVAPRVGFRRALREIMRDHARCLWVARGPRWVLGLIVYIARVMIAVSNGEQPSRPLARVSQRGGWCLISITLILNVGFLEIPWKFLVSETALEKGKSIPLPNPTSDCSENFGQVSSKVGGEKWLTRLPACPRHS